MNPKFHYLVLLCFFSISSIVAYPDIYTQLCGINNEWYNIIPSGELLEKKQFLSEKEIITYHLQQVEKHLTKKNINHLPEEIQQRRKEGLEVLRAYWQRGLYPKNNQFNFRIPFFIDDYNTACAVGYIMQGTGNEALAKNIAETQNNAYVKEMVGDDILEWASNYGFTVDELAWIQPQYQPCEYAPVYVQSSVLPTCGNSDGTLEIMGSDIISYEWEHGANGLTLNNLPAGIYTLTGTYIDDFGGITECPFKKQFALENDHNINLTVKTLNDQSCEDIVDGMAEVIVNNANGIYNFEWSNGETTRFASNLTEGRHFVTVTDEINCKAIERAYVYMNNPLISREVVSGTACNDNTGSVNLNMFGGSEIGVYNVQWMDGNTLENRTNMAEGDYSVVISDDDGCFIEKEITIYDDCDGKISCTDDYMDINNAHGGYIFQLLNDFVPSNRTITSFEVTRPNHGWAYNESLHNNKRIYYYAFEPYSGPDSLTYTVCTNYGFCDSAKVYLNLVDRPVVSLSNSHNENMQIYLGDRVRLVLRGAENYYISTLNGLDIGSITYSSVWVSPTETTTYTITGTNTNGQTDTYDITIEVIEPNFEAFEDAIQVHKDFDDNRIYLKGQLQVLDIAILDSADNIVTNLPTQNNTLTIQLSNFDNGLYYLHIQHKDYPDVSTTTILKD